ncbi:hypothetical protein LTS18_000825, partial [Coniosporium uncinatum]
KPQKASVLKQEERAFPRGGGSVLTPLEHKQIQIDATRDVLFEQAGKPTQNTEYEDAGENAAPGTKLVEKRKKKSKEKKTGATKVKEEPKIKVEGLSYKRLVPGSLVLGKVSRITSRDVALALPNNLTGYIPLTAVSDQLTRRIEKLLAEEEKEGEEEQDEDYEDVELNKLFKVGQYLRAYVTSTANESSKPGRAGKKRIELSTNPKLANHGIMTSDIVTNCMLQASVKSVEDYGLVMDLGTEDSSIRGFMSSKELGPGVDHTKVEEGAVFMCIVTGLSSNGKIVKLSADHKKAGNVKKANYLTEAPSINSFLPGTAVEMLVTEPTSTDLTGQAMGMLSVTADIIHSGSSRTKKDLVKQHPAGSKVKARIICTFPDADPPKLA